MKTKFKNKKRINITSKKATVMSGITEVREGAWGYPMCIMDEYQKYDKNVINENFSLSAVVENYFNFFNGTGSDSNFVITSSQLINICRGGRKYIKEGGSMLYETV